MDVDIEKLEQQRYDAIKKAGEYLELNVLIGPEEKTDDDSLGIVPVMKLSHHNCDSKSIGALYLLLKELTDKLEKDYPVECFIAKLCLSGDTLAEYQIDLKTGEQRKKDKKDEN